MNPISRLFAWLSSFLDGGYVAVPPVYTASRRRYARTICEHCGKSIAVTQDGRLWRHRCGRGTAPETPVAVRDSQPDTPSDSISAQTCDRLHITATHNTAPSTPTEAAHD